MGAGGGVSAWRSFSVNETKLAGLVKANELRPMQAEELEKYFGGPAGYLGPIGLGVSKHLHDGGVNVFSTRASRRARTWWRGRISSTTTSAM